MKRILTIEVSRTGASPWVITDVDADGETVDEEKGVYLDDQENTDENGNVYDLDDLAQYADEVYECDSLASRRNLRQIKP